MPAGYTTMAAMFVEYAGLAHMSVRWDAGTGDNVDRPLPWDTLPLPPTPAPISVTVNGVPALHACPSTQLDLAQGQDALPGLPTSLVTDEDSCIYAFSVYRSPAVSGLSPATVSAPGQVLLLNGTWLVGSVAAITITVAGEGRRHSAEP